MKNRPCDFRAWPMLASAIAACYAAPPPPAPGAFPRPRWYAHATACSAGRGAGCAALATFYALGEDAADDVSSAVPVLQREADAGNARAALVLGAVYLRGRGVPADPARAAALLERACDGGLVMGCYLLERAHRRGTAAPLDAARVESLERRACEGGFGRECSRYEAAEQCGAVDLDANAIYARLRAGQPAFQACYERALARSPTLGGWVTIAFTIDCTGRVHGAPRTWGLWAAQSVGDCVGDAIRRMAFPASPHAVEFSFPLRFTPG